MQGATINVQDETGRTTPLNYYLAHADSWDHKTAEALVREGVPCECYKVFGTWKRTSTYKN